MSRILFKEGQRFGRLTIICLDHIKTQQQKKIINKKEYLSKRNYEFYKCKCDCGKEKIVSKQCLLNGDTKSCGCLNDELRKQRLIDRWKESFRTKKFGTNILNLLNAMKRRCYNKNTINYNRYGGKGVTICDEWLDKENGANNFYNWAINNSYSPNKQIDRIDFKKGYEPNNCRFVDIITQARNKSNNHLVTYNNKTHCITEWVEKINEYDSNLGINNENLQLRIVRYNIKPPLAFLKPVDHNTHKKVQINELDFINFLNKRNEKSSI